jgi:hypothetical protein
MNGTVKNEITFFYHCAKCLDEIPEGTSPRDYAQLEVGQTEIGIQVWCRRHDIDVVHLDLRAIKVEKASNSDE